MRNQRRLFAVLLALLLLCSCAKTGRTAEQPDASAKAEQTELPPEETAPETAEADPSDDHTAGDPTEAISAEDEIALMRELEARTALHPAHPALDTQWLDRRAMSKWVLPFQQQIEVYGPRLRDADWAADLYALTEIGDYLGALTFSDGSEAVYLKILLAADTVDALPAADGAQLAAAAAAGSPEDERILPETLPELYYETFLSDLEAAYSGGLSFESPAELTEEALYTSFQIFAEERNLLDRWDAAAGAYLFSELQICEVLDRYYEGYTFRIEEDPQYDPARQAIAAQVIGGFGGGTHVRVLEIRAEGSVCTIRGSVLDGNDAPLGQKEYVLDFYDGGFYIRAVRALPDGDHG